MVRIQSSDDTINGVTLGGVHYPSCEGVIEIPDDKLELALSLLCLVNGAVRHTFTRSSSPASVKVETLVEKSVEKWQ